jgi:hypothetical protein
MNPQPQHTATTLDTAIALGKAGYKVFPVIENGKIPAVGGWQHRATSDEQEIRKLWTENDSVLNVTRVKPYNVGISTVGLLVVDVDTKEGKPGLRSLDELDLMYGFPETYTVETASGGLHLYFKPKNPVGNSASKIGPGLDIRGNGGYVLAEGSVIDGRSYRIVKPVLVADAPEWLEDLAGRPLEAKKGQVVELLDTKPALDRAKSYLETAAPAIEGNGGDSQTFKVAARVKDFGVSELACLELMHDHWNERCSPTWDWESLALKVSNAYHYGKKPVGTESAQADFDAVAEAPTATPRPRLFVREWSEIKPRLADAYLIQKLLGEGAMSVVYGESNVGKTFFAMGMAYSIASGTPFAGRKAEKGATLYVAAEAGLSAENRVAALRRHHKGDDVPFGLVPCPVDLLRPSGDTQALVELVRQYEAKHGKVRLIVIDTLSRAIAGGNENSPDDMGALVKHLDALRVATKAHVMVVHHSGKDTAKGARGHSLLRAATDTEIEIQAGVAKITKQRDMDMGAPIGFDLKVVDLGTSRDGETVTSCVVIPLTESQMEFQGDVEFRLALMTVALRDAVKANGGRPVAVELWNGLCRDYIINGIIDGDKRVKSEAFLGVSAGSLKTILNRLRKQGEQRGLFKETKSDHWVTV